MLGKVGPGGRVIKCLLIDIAKKPKKLVSEFGSMRKEKAESKYE